MLTILEWLTSISVSILLGWSILLYIPENKKPPLRVPEKLLIVFALFIPLFAFGNVWSVAVALSGQQQVTKTLFLVVTETRVGQAWFVLTFLAMLLALSLYLQSYKHIQMTFTIGLLLALSYSSHAASQNVWIGLGAHLIHFLTVATWAGIVFHVGWFAKPNKQWKAFLSWFTPIAIACVVLSFSTGLLIMWLIVGLDQYVNSWSTPYGHALLLKHLTIAPLLLFAIINGLLSRKVQHNHHFSPIHWIRGESIILLLVFLWTAIMTTQSPPLNIEHIATHSMIFPLIYGQSVSLPLQIEVTVMGVLFLAIALLFASYLVIGVYKKMNVWMSVLCSFLLIFALYISVLTSIRI
ncbi:copper resistance D family protein [Metabacillus iocasae]|uniref:Copper resistance protein D n=1 Tax=Priestia iocasae TaxID=2291674 RepID=A0ABS2QWI4_9BACI|nr:CopD family protein [Metabacillus iocasae]MBM7703839.1 putative copper resistance protein D [Metabacillus iocasae]